MAALDTNDAVEIDGANRDAALLEDAPLRSSTSPWNTRIRAVAAASARSRLDAHRLRGDVPRFVSPTSSRRWRARISDAPIAVARTRWVFWSTSIVTSTFSGAAPSFTTASNASRLDTLEIFRLRVGDHALDAFANQRKRDADGGNDFGVLRNL